MTRSEISCTALRQNDLDGATLLSILMLNRCDGCLTREPLSQHQHLGTR